MTRCKCYTCGSVFKTKTEKKTHKAKYPNGRCEGLKGGIKEMEKQEEKKDLKLSNIKVPKISMPKGQAKEEWQKYCDLLKKRKDKYLQVMKQATYHMKKGKELIDVYLIAKKFGLNKKGLPRIAVSRADIPELFFRKRDPGTGRFEMQEDNWGGSKDDIELPQNTYDIHWGRTDPNNRWSIIKERVKTKVPRVPIELMPEGNLRSYYILWEVKEWENIPPAKDPLLLKRISQNLFVILGAWEVTPLEQSIMRGAGSR